MKKILKTPEEKARTKLKSNQNWYLNNPGKHAEGHENWIAKKPENWLRIQRRSRIKKYNLTLEQFEDMVKQQKGKCLGCGKSFPTDRAPAIDHDRKCCQGNKSCGKCVRGILCKFCNLGLGYAQDNIQTLKNWIIYLGGTL